MNEQEKIANFLKEYGELTKKYGIDLISYPVFVPKEKDKGQFPSFELTIQTMPVSTEKKKESFFK